MALTAAGSPHSIVARYLGDSNYNGSDNVTTPLSQTVSALATTIGRKRIAFKFHQRQHGGDLYGTACRRTLCGIPRGDGNIYD
jgi:hypothetical protein